MTPHTETPVLEHDEPAPDPTRRQRPLAWLAWLLPFVIFACALLLRAAAKRAPAFTEYYYGRHIFPGIGHSLSFVNRIFGFSIGEVTVVLLIAFLVGATIYQALQVVQRQKRVRQVLRSDMLAALWALSLATLLFMLLWGLNYDRQPLSTSLALAKQTPTDEQFEVISRTIVNGVNTNYDASHGEACCASASRTELYAAVESAYQNAPLLSQRCGSGYAQPKPIRLSGIMSWLGISGVYMPWTGEANYNRMQPDFDLPYSIAHEKAHQCGVAREDEANFVAFLVCSNSSDPFVRYSGYLNALRVLDELGVSAPERYREVAAMLGQGPRADLKARADFWSRFEGRGVQVSYRINNTYLRANNVPNGTRSYSEDVALIISYYLKTAMGGQEGSLRA